MADADPRLGPVLEVVLNGRYFWVPLQRIRRIEFDAPADLRDTIWTAASFTWTNGAQTVGLVPTRYNGTVAMADDGLMLARRTEWTEEGNPIGQRMLVTDAGDYALMDIRIVEFDAVADDAADLDQHG
jgi:type VI secretion system protein ImpE